MPPPARAKRPQPKPKTKKQPRPDLPQHRLAAPYAKLFRMGKGDFPEVYEAIASELKRGDVNAAARQLLSMVLDETYYDYTEEDDETETGDPRSWTRLHALCTFQLLGDAARIGIEPLLSLLDDDDDYVNEASAFYYAAMGEPAIEPLAKALTDSDEDTYYRAGAGGALAEMGEQHPELRDRIVSILEQALILEQEDKTTVALLISNLLDLDARESLPIIQQAFAEERVDLSVLQMPEVEEHFELPVVTPYIDWTKLPEFADEMGEDYEDWSEEAPPLAPDDEEPREIQTPFVAEAKVGRNDPCPCGSGKKYKKCCGA
jgi:tetratricopeptide (TPR) repeat protein